MHYGSNISAEAGSQDLSVSEIPWSGMRVPGLTISSGDYERLKETVRKQHAVMSYKKKKQLLWIVLMGGTGTGKSTIFNALCGRQISGTGYERPKTEGPILYCHKDFSLEEDFPFPEYRMERRTAGEKVSGFTGYPGSFVVVEHSIQELKHLALVDSPDVDSLSLQNRLIAEDIYLLADIIVFVASQEKYADDVPVRFLSRIQRESKSFFFLFNKADANLNPQEIISFYQQQYIMIPLERFHVLPYVNSPSFSLIFAQSQLQRFLHAFYTETEQAAASALIGEEGERAAHELYEAIDNLIGLGQAENAAAEKWLLNVDSLFAESSRELLGSLEKGGTKENRAYFQAKIKEIFNKYDVLAKPRRFIADLVLMPLRVFGFKIRNERVLHREELKEVQRQVDIPPLAGIVTRFNRNILESLSSSMPDSLLNDRIRQLEVVLTEEEINKGIKAVREELALWLEDTFQTLARGIPRTKQIGIYSTSVLWGTMVIAFEFVLGGGLSLIEALLDPFIAPFLTKGSVELFAYHEIRRISREMDKRYKEGLLSLLQEQRDRYELILLSLMIPESTTEALRMLQKNIGKQ